MSRRHTPDKPETDDRDEWFVEAKHDDSGFFVGFTVTPAMWEVLDEELIPDEPAPRRKRNG